MQSKCRGSSSPYTNLSNSVHSAAAIATPLAATPLQSSPASSKRKSFFARQCWLHNSRVQRQTWAGTDSAASQRSLLSVKHALCCWSTSSQEQVPMQATCVTSTGVILSLSLEHWASGRSCRYCTARRCTGLGWAGRAQPSAALLLCLIYLIKTLLQSRGYHGPCGSKCKGRARKKVKFNRSQRW